MCFLFLIFILCLEISVNMEVLLNPVERIFFFLTALSPYTSLHHVNLEIGRKLDFCYLQKSEERKQWLKRKMM